MKKFAGAARVKVSKVVDLEVTDSKDPHEIIADSAQNTTKSLKENLDLTEEEFKELLDIKLPSGETIITPVLSGIIEEDSKITENIYEIIALIKRFGFKETVRFLKTVQNRTDIMFSSPFMEKSKIVAEYEKDLIRDLQKEIVESGIPCSKCHQKKVVMDAKQTRSADEPMTVFYKCYAPNCGYQWRSN